MGNMRMSPTDILDVSRATYTYLMNGQPPAANWTALFRPGERVRLRFVDAGTMSIFDVRIPGLNMTVVQSDGNDIVPVTVDEFRIGPGETYDVIVEPCEPQAYTIFAQAQDRAGYARGTLAPQPGMNAAMPPMDPRPMRTMADMGMEHGAGGHGGFGPAAAMPSPSSDPHAGHAMPGAGSNSGPAAPSGSMLGMNHGAGSGAAQDHTAHGATPGRKRSGCGSGVNDSNVRAAQPDLRNAKRGNDLRPPTREIVLHLTGNMEHFMWSFDGTKFSDAAPVMMKLGERVRFTLINHTMMDHPMHLHGVWSELEWARGFEQRDSKRRESGSLRPRCIEFCA